MNDGNEVLQVNNDRQTPANVQLGMTGEIVFLLMRLSCPHLPFSFISKWTWGTMIGEKFIYKIVNLIPTLDQHHLEYVFLSSKPLVETDP